MAHPDYSSSSVGRRQYLRSAANAARALVAVPFLESCVRRGARSAPFTSGARHAISFPTGARLPSLDRLNESLRIDPLSLGGRHIDPGQAFILENLPRFASQGDRNSCVAFAFTALHEQVHFVSAG
jgi:hypothetical protein